jgi:hypothetical protein
MCFDFLENLCLEHFSLSELSEIWSKNILVFMQNTRYPCQILIKLDIARYIFEKYPNIKFHDNQASGSRVVPCGRTGRHDEANRRYTQFCEHA